MNTFLDDSFGECLSVDDWRRLGRALAQLNNRPLLKEYHQTASPREVAAVLAGAGARDPASLSALLMSRFQLFKR